MNDSRLIFGERLTFDQQKHCYTWAGKKVPGVTTILKVIDKPALVQWSANQASDYFLKQLNSGRTDLEVIHKESRTAHYKSMKDAASIGSNVHDYTESYFKGLELPKLKTDQAKRGAEAFHKWEQAHKIKVLAVERRIYSKQYNYAGTTDLIAEIDGELGVLDYKTSSGIYPEMRFQTAAYQQGLQEEKNMKFDMRGIIRFDKKTGEFEAKQFYDFDLDFSGFKAAMDLHNTLQAMKSKKGKKK